MLGQRGRESQGLLLLPPENQRSAQITSMLNPPLIIKSDTNPASSTHNKVRLILPIGLMISFGNYNGLKRTGSYPLL
jgi:hypothetical protein